MAERQWPGRSAMAEYRRRRALYAAERRDRLPRAAAVAALLAGGLGLLVGLGLGLLGVSAGTAARWALALAAVVVSAVRFFRPAPEVESWRADAEAERRTARSLDRLTRAGYTVLHDRVMPDSAGNIDHLVLGPSGVWVVDSDAHRGLLRHDRGPVGRSGAAAGTPEPRPVDGRGDHDAAARRPAGGLADERAAGGGVRPRRVAPRPGAAGRRRAAARRRRRRVRAVGRRRAHPARRRDARRRRGAHVPAVPRAGHPPGWPARSRLRGLLGR